MLYLFAGCSSNPKFKDFQTDLWHQDLKGCSGFRERYVEKILNSKEDFLGMDDDKLADLLGKPDKIFYSKRGKKTYEYFITPGKQCNNGLMIEGSKIVFEINSIGYVNLLFEKKF